MRKNKKKEEWERNTMKKRKEKIAQEEKKNGQCYDVEEKEGEEEGE